jgi:hypothetical protein
VPLVLLINRLPPSVMQVTATTTKEQQLQSPNTNHDKSNSALAAIAEDAGEGNDNVVFLRRILEGILCMVPVGPYSHKR